MEHLPKRSSRLIFSVFALLSALSCAEEPEPFVPARGLQVTFVDVGQGDAALVVGPGGESILVDGGGDGMGAAVVVPLLEKRGVTRLDLLVVSHPHADHVGGLDEVLDAVEVEEIWENGEGATTDAWARYAVARDHSGAQLYTPLPGHERLVGSLRVEVLATNRGLPGANDDSLVVLVSLGEIDFLFTGDIEEAGSAALVAGDTGLEAEVLKVPHHGSAHVHPSLAAAVDPELAVISVGAANPYGHPSPSTLASYAALGATVCRTDLAGNIEVTTDGASVSFDCPHME